MKIWKMRYFAVLLLPLLISSCATIFNGKTYLMDVCAEQPNSSLSIYDTTYRLPAKIKVNRSINDLQVTLKTDSIHKDFTLKASPSRTTVFASLPFVYYMPIPLVIDHYTQRRYYYGQNIVLDANDTETVLNNGFFPKFRHRVYDYFRRPYPAKKGQLNFIMCGPSQNNLYLDNSYGAKDFNFLGGVKAGVEYFYTDDGFYSLAAGYVRGIVFRNFGDADEPYSYVSPFSLSFELKNNYAHKRFTFGYGVSYSVNSVIYEREMPNRRARSDNKNLESKYHTYTAGLAMSTHFRFHSQTFFGVNYRPNLLILQHERVKFGYEHLLSLELLYKIRLKK